MLFRSLSAFVVGIPPLCQRPEDIPLLAAHFFHRELAHTVRTSPGITRDALGALVCAPWPGNVRQLENEIAKAVLLLRDGETLDRHHLSMEVQSAGAADAGGPPLSLAEAVREAEARAIRVALATAGDDPARARELLDIGKTTFYKKLKEHQVRE